MNKIKEVCRRFYIIQGILFGIVTIFLSFISFEDMNIESTLVKLLCLSSMLLLAIIIAVISTYCQTSNVIWREGNASITLKYGDLEDISFRRVSNDNKQIVVIPVNTHYDTTVSDKMVSSKSLHGQWIQWMQKNTGVIPKKLNTQIQGAAKAQKIGYIHYDKDRKGNRKAYESGTVIDLKHDNTRFFLLALSEFDENLNAQTTRRQLIDVIEKLIDYYDQNGNGQPIYIPLMGTGLSRANITQKESLKLLSDMFLLYKDKIHSTVNIVVYDKCRDDVSIFL